MTSNKRNLNPMINLLKPEVEELIQSKDWKVLKDVISTWYASDRWCPKSGGKWLGPHRHFAKLYPPLPQAMFARFFCSSALKLK
ncbi:hypothetical protein J7M23_01315, partial [Candidatus Sumerlaeota bacterium]|nr:hypothetical protein [Candidatus Sumerlaeota bacterium]